MKTISFTFLLFLISLTSFAQVIFVDNTPPENPIGDYGTIGNPYLTLADATASNVAQIPGAIINIRGGVYREGEITHLGVGQPNKYITFQSYNNEEVVIKGSDTIYDTFTHYQDDIWIVDNVNFNAQQIFWNGNMLRKSGYPNLRFNPNQEPGEDPDGLNPYQNMGFEVYNPINECSSEPFNMCEGTFYFDEQYSKLYLWLPGGLNPNFETIEISDKRWLWRNINGQYIKLKGLHFMHTSVLGFKTGQGIYNLQGAAVTLGKYGIVEDCVFSFCDSAGLHFNNLNDVKGADLGQIVRNSTFHHNGVIGLSANKVGGLLVEDNTFYKNSFRPFNANWSSAAIKFIPHTWAEVKNNYIHDEYGQGIWFDTCINNNEILVHNNYIENIGIAIDDPLIEEDKNGHGIFIELTPNAKVYNNIIINAYHRGVYLATTWDCKVANNLIVNTQNRGQIGLNYKKREDNGIDYTSYDNEIYNNILYEKQSAMDIEVISEGNPNYSSSNVFNRNLIYNNNGNYLYKHLAYLTTPGPNFSNLTDWYNVTGNGEHSIEGLDPNFLFTGNHLVDHWSIGFNSPALNKGKFLNYVSDDYLGLSRPQRKYDIGPYEYDYGLSRISFNEENKIIIYPNPTDGNISIRNNTKSKIETVTVYDATGKQMQILNKGFNEAIDMSGLSVGFYFVKIKLSTNSTVVKKIVVK